MISATIQGIPCLINVTHFLCQKPWKGSAQSCPSSDDYYGFTEIEFEVYDRKGYKAEWLARKMTTNDIESIEELISKEFAE